MDDCLTNLSKARVDSTVHSTLKMYKPRSCIFPKDKQKLNSILMNCLVRKMKQNPHCRFQPWSNKNSQGF